MRLCPVLVTASLTICAHLAMLLPAAILALYSAWELPLFNKMADDGQKLVEWRTGAKKELSARCATNMISRLLFSFTP